jgi:Xaa-Pro aminopeptidase
MTKLKVIKNRIEKFINNILKQSIDGALLTCDESVFYFSGFKGDSTQVLITKDKSYLFTDFRYVEQAEKQSADILTVVETGRVERNKTIDERLKKHKIESLGLENDHLVVSQFETYKNDLSVKKLTNISEEIKFLRAIKTSDELAIIRKAAEINDDVFLQLIKQIKTGISEKDIYSELTYLFNKRGCSHAFTPIIAGGPNSALPHAPLTDRKIKNGDFLTIDFGAKLDAYCSDCTRTIGIGGLDSEQKKVYYIVKNAQEISLNAAKAGIKAKDLDEVARNFISENGYKDCFGHGLGHGVGLFIHEYPTLNPNTETVLKEGMVVTIEPGIYIKGKYGVRIEDTVVIENDGITNFNSLYKDLIII